MPGSWLGSPWDIYAEFIDGRLTAYYGSSVLNRGPLDPVLLTTVTVFALLPQLLLAVIGGLLGVRPSVVRGSGR